MIPGRKDEDAERDEDDGEDQWAFEASGKVAPLEISPDFGLRVDLTFVVGGIGRERRSALGLHNAREFERLHIPSRGGNCNSHDDRGDDGEQKLAVIEYGGGRFPRIA